MVEVATLTHSKQAMEAIISNSLDIYIKMKKAEAKADRFARELEKANRLLTPEQFNQYVLETQKYEDMIQRKMDDEFIKEAAVAIAEQFRS